MKMSNYKQVIALSFMQIIKQIYSQVNLDRQLSLGMITKSSIFVFLLAFYGSCFTMNKISESPQDKISGDSTVFVVFKGVYPDQKLNKNDQIYIRGDNCNLTWNAGIPLSRNGNNTWSTMLACPTGVRIQAKLVLNDKIWMMGPNQWFIANERLNLTITPSFFPSINKVYDTENVRSLILNNSRRCSIYLPPSYQENPFKKYPLVFMHDGQNLFEDSKAAFGTAWRIQNTLDELIGKSQIEQVIIVGIWNNNDRIGEYTYSYDPFYMMGGKGDKYLDFIQKQLQPVVSQKWFPNRIKNQQGYSIGGSSLGGLISCYAMYTRPQFFRNAICMSSSFWWNYQDFNTTVLTDQYNPRTLVYIDSGDFGDSQDGRVQTLTVKAHLEKNGYNSIPKSHNLFYYLDKGGQHSQYYWGRRFHIPMKSLFNSSYPSSP